MNILITGANGFIGSNLCSLFQQNTTVNIFRGTRHSIDLLSYSNVSEYIQKNNIDTIIHCAIEGGRRNVIDSESIVYKNILMAQNLLACPIKGLFINIASGAEFDRNKNIFNFDESNLYKQIPTDYYGISKNVIAKLTNNLTNGFNLRIFGCFNYNEDINRMIRYNLTRYIQKQPIIIHQNKYFDFIYVKDLYQLIWFIVNNYNKCFIPSDINVVYDKKYTLLDIATIINNLDSHKVPVIIQEIQLDKNYCGDGSRYLNLNIPCIGVENGLKECYKSIVI